MTAKEVNYMFHNLSTTRKASTQLTAFEDAHLEHPSPDTSAERKCLFRIRMQRELVARDTNVVVRALTDFSGTANNLFFEDKT